MHTLLLASLVLVSSPRPDDAVPMRTRVSISAEVASEHRLLLERDESDAIGVMEVLAAMDALELRVRHLGEERALDRTARLRAEAARIRFQEPADETARTLVSQARRVRRARCLDGHVGAAFPMRAEAFSALGRESADVASRSIEPVLTEHEARLDELLGLSSGSTRPGPEASTWSSPRSPPRWSALAVLDLNDRTLGTLDALLPPSSSLQLRLSYATFRYPALVDCDTVDHEEAKRLVALSGVLDALVRQELGAGATQLTEAQRLRINARLQGAAEQRAEDPQPDGGFPEAHASPQAILIPGLSKAIEFGDASEEAVRGFADQLERAESVEPEVRRRVVEGLRGGWWSDYVAATSFPARVLGGSLRERGATLAEDYAAFAAARSRAELLLDQQVLDGLPEEWVDRWRGARAHLRRSRWLPAVCSSDPLRGSAVGRVIDATLDWRPRGATDAARQTASAAVVDQVLISLATDWPAATAKALRSVVDFEAGTVTEEELSRSAMAEHDLILRAMARAWNETRGLIRSLSEESKSALLEELQATLAPYLEESRVSSIVGRLEVSRLPPGEATDEIHDLVLTLETARESLDARYVDELMNRVDARLSRRDSQRQSRATLEALRREIYEAERRTVLFVTEALRRNGIEPLAATTLAWIWATDASP